MEADGGCGGGGAGDQEEMSLAHSLREDQAAVIMGRQLDALQERVQVFENIIFVLNREVEKVQQSMAAMERDGQSTQDIRRVLEAKVGSLSSRLQGKLQ